MSDTHLQVVELAPFNEVDGELLAATRYKGNVYAGVRVGGAIEDRRFWVSGRYGFHKDKTYEGFWGGVNQPMQIFARDLEIVNGLVSDMPDSPDLFVALAGTAHILKFKLVGETSGPNSTGSYQLQIYNALSGATAYTVLIGDVDVPTGGVANRAHVLPLLVAGAYTVWVRFNARSEYAGLPPDFQTVTGIDPATVPTWKDPVTGLVYQFSAEWAVGALPRSGAILDDYLKLQADGKVNKRPQWIAYLYETDELGVGILHHSEWSMVRLLVQTLVPSVAWPSEHTVSPLACPGAPLRILQGNVLMPHSLRSSMRSVGAFKLIDDHLFLGAMEAGKNGRYATIIETGNLVDNDTDAARGQTSTDRIWCECAMTNETVQSLARFPDRADGTIFGTTSCELFERVDYLPPGKRLVGSDPGGRALSITRPLTGNGIMARAVESDFSKSSASWPSNAYVVTTTTLAQKTGPGIQALYNSVLWEWNGRVWGIAGADPDLWLKATSDADRTRALSLQSLCYFNGATWTKVASWPKKLYYYSRGAACGAQMLMFGRRELDKRPVAGRFDGYSLQTGVLLPYYVERADTVLSADGKKETVLLTGVKADPGALDNTVLDGFFLAETDGSFVGDVPGGGNDPKNGDEALPLMPPGTVVYNGRYNVAAQTLTFSVADGVSTSGAAMCSAFPFCLWARVDGATPMPLFEGEPTQAVHSLLREYDIPLKYGTPKAMPRPVTKWLDVVVLVAPSYTWSTVIQPF